MAGSGRMQLCVPMFVESAEEAQRIFAKDMASGLFEEICQTLGAERSAAIRSELGPESFGTIHLTRGAAEDSRD